MIYCEPSPKNGLATGSKMKLRFFGIVAAATCSLAICDGQGTISTFFATGTSGLAIDAQGNVYLTESSTARVRKISSGILSTIAGNGNFGYAGDGGQAINATLRLGTGGLSGLAVDSSGNVYFADSSNNVIRKINTAGIISTYAGNGTGAGTGFGGFAGDNGPATSAQLDSPTDIAIDSNGNLYICDTANSRVRKVTAGGTITTFAGNGHVVFEGDGVQASTTAVPSPGGIAVDTQGERLHLQRVARAQGHPGWNHHYDRWQRNPRLLRRRRARHGRFLLGPHWTRRGPIRQRVRHR